jgi:hypothetical protein
VHLIRSTLDTDSIIETSSNAFECIVIKINTLSYLKAVTAESTELERVRRYNKALVKKIKGLQCQLQAMVDKLRKEKIKVSGNMRCGHCFSLVKKIVVCLLNCFDWNNSLS